MSLLRVKLGLIFVGAPLALAAEPIGQRWLFYGGLGLLVLALLIPARPGQTTKERLVNLSRHFPGLRRRH